MRFIKKILWGMAFLAPGFLCSSVWADLSQKAEPATSSVMVLLRTTTLNAIARALYPGSATDREAYRAAIAQANPETFSGAKSLGSVPLAAGQQLLLPAGLSVPSKIATTVVVHARGGSKVPFDSTQLGALAKEAARRGIKTCLQKVDQVSALSGNGGVVGVMFFNASQDQDRKLFSTSVELADGEQSSYASTTYAPTVDEGCGALHEAVTWHPEICANLVVRSFSQAKVIGMLMKNIQVLDAGSGTTVFLMSAGKGCVSIRKAVY